MRSEPALPSGSFDFERYIEFGEDKWLVDRKFTTPQQLATYMQEGITSANSRLMEVKFTDPDIQGMQRNMVDALAMISLVVSHPCVSGHQECLDVIVANDMIQTCNTAVSELRAVEQNVDSRLTKTASQKKTLQWKRCGNFILYVMITTMFVGLVKLLWKSELAFEVMTFFASCFFAIILIVGEKYFYQDGYDAVKGLSSDLTRFKRIITMTIFNVEGALVNHVEEALVDRCLQLVQET